MRKSLAAVLIVSALLAAASAGLAEEVKLSYALIIDRPETGVGYVTMNVSGLTSQGFSLNRSAAAGEAWFDAVKAAAPDGRAMEVVPTAEGYYVTTGGAPAATITYVIRPGSVGEYGHIGLIAADFAALDGALIFLLPGSELEVKDAYASFTVPQPWKVITNWQSTADGWRPDTALAPLRTQLASSLICFGDFAASPKSIGGNTLAIYMPLSFPAADAAELSALLEKIYARIQGILGFETGATYNVVCLPPAPDGLPVVAGAWADGQALTLVGRFSLPETLKYVQTYSRFVMLGYFAGPPYGARVPAEDQWLYPAVLAYSEGLGSTISGKMIENVFYSPIYSRYAAEASSDISSIDLPAAQFATATGDARAFIASTKAPILLMRLDFEIRVASGYTKTIDDFLKALYQAPSSPDEVAEPLEVLEKLTGNDFTDFWGKYVRTRTVLLPTWPAFIEIISEQKPENSVVVAQVDGAPIFQREVSVMSEAIESEGFVTNKDDIRQAALNALIQERLMDKALSGFRVNVVPEAFWQLRMALPGKVMKVLMARKRQTLKDLLYNDWLMKAGTESKVEIEPSQPAKDAASGPR